MNIEKFEKLVANLHVKTEYIIHIRNLKQALNYGLVLKKMHRFIKFKLKAWLKSYIDIKDTHPLECNCTAFLYYLKHLYLLLVKVDTATKTDNTRTICTSFFLF